LPSPGDVQFGGERLHKGEYFGKPCAGQSFDFLEELFFEGHRVFYGCILWAIALSF